MIRKLLCFLVAISIVSCFGDNKSKPITRIDPNDPKSLKHELEHKPVTEQEHKPVTEQEPEPETDSTPTKVIETSEFKVVNNKVYADLKGNLVTDPTMQMAWDEIKIKELKK